jgi:TonB family protein
MMILSTKNIAFILFMIFIFNTINAQVDTLYFTKDKDPCEKKNAFYCRHITMADANNVRISDFLMNGEKYAEGISPDYPMWFRYKRVGIFTLFYPNGQVKKRGVCSADEYVGKVKEYFENGQLYKLLLYPTPEEKTAKSKKNAHTKIESEDEFRLLELYDSLGKGLVINGFGYAKESNETLNEEGIYKNGVRDSVWIGCYKNGKLCYRETYEKGVLKEGFSHDTLDEKRTYSKVYQKPAFGNSEKDFFIFLTDNVKYPLQARTKGIEGTVYIKFIVEKDGSIKNMYCVNNTKITKELEQEALRVVAKTNGLWKAGTMRAIPTSVSFMLPIRFSLQ